MCQERVTEVVDALRRAGLADGRVSLYAVSTGAPHTAYGVAEELQLTDAETASWVTFLCDEDRKLYDALGAHRGVLRTFTWKRWTNVKGLFLSGLQCCRGRLPQLNAGDPWQQGGVFVLSPSGAVVFEHRETSPGWPQLEHDAFLSAVLREAGKAAPVEGAAAAAPGEDPSAPTSGSATEIRQRRGSRAGLLAAAARGTK